MLSSLFLLGVLTMIMKAPLTIQNNSPMEMVHQFFVKLGARYVIVTDTNGLCACCSNFYMIKY